MSEPVEITAAIELPKKDKTAEELQVMAMVSYNELAHKYRLLEDTEGKFVLARAVAPGVLRCVDKDDVLSLDLIRRWGATILPGKVRSELFPRWHAEMRNRAGSCIPYADVKPFRFASDMAAGWAWQRLAFDPPTEPVPAPELFASVLARTSAEEALSIKLFIGSLFDYTSDRHQYLYLHGKGSDGKSTLLAAMFAMFNSRGCRTMRGDSLDSTHATAGLEGVRLLAFPDCNRPTLPSTGIFKELTGDDTTSINPKNRDIRNISVFCKVVISSNDAPQLAGGAADERRILPAKFMREGTSSNAQWKRDFIASAPLIAQHCIGIYQEWRKSNPHGEIPQASAAMEIVRDNTVQTTAEDLVSRLFYFNDPNAFIRSSVLNEIIKQHTRHDPVLAKQVKKVIQDRVKSGTKRFGDEVAKGWKGIHELPQIDMIVEPATPVTAL
jgi:hypothetical protein